jgi:hypothetical protein
MSVMKPIMMRLAGLFIPDARAAVEMMYQFTEPFIVDSSRMQDRLGLAPTAIQAGIERMLHWYMNVFAHHRAHTNTRSSRSRRDTKSVLALCLRTVCRQLELGGRPALRIDAARQTTNPCSARHASRTEALRQAAMGDRIEAPVSNDITTSASVAIDGSPNQSFRPSNTPRRLC